MHTCHAEKTCQMSLPRTTACARSVPAVRHSVRTPVRCTCTAPEQATNRHLRTRQMMTLAAAIAPLLVPLQVLSAEQISVADAGVASPEAIRIAAVAIPAVAFGAATLISQAKQAQEDRALRLKAIAQHNTFLSTQEEDEAMARATQLAMATSPASSLALQSSGGPAQSSTSSSDEPDCAAPAMLDQPERPEPRMPSFDEEAASSQPSDADKHAKLPPGTAVLDRPDRPEPETSHDEPADLQSSITPQSGAFAFSTASDSTAARPGSPATNEEAALRDAEYQAKQAKMSSLKGVRPPMPAQRGPQQPQGSDMATEYAAKLAALHEESAARAAADLRKRQERYAMLADLQAQAQMEKPAAPLQPKGAKPLILQGQKMWGLVLAFLLRPLQWLRVLARKIMGWRQHRAEKQAQMQYSTTG